MPQTTDPTPKRRWYRFSLRTLLIVLVLLSLLLGWFALKIRQAQRQRQVVEAIQKAGGWVRYDFEVDESGAPIGGEKWPGLAWLRKLFGEDLLGDVDTVGSFGSEVSDVLLEQFKGLADLKRLHLTGVPVTDAGIEHLKGLTNLQVLDLSGTQMTDLGLQHLKGLTNLQVLWLSDTQVTDAGLQHLKGLPSLEQLNLSGTQVTDTGLDDLKGLTLNLLVLSDTQVTVEGIDELQKAIPSCRIVVWAGPPSNRQQVRP